MEKRLGKKVYRKMPTMQVMTGCLCITVCNDAGVDMLVYNYYWQK